MQIFLGWKENRNVLTDDSSISGIIYVNMNLLSIHKKVSVNPHVFTMYI